MKKRVPTVKQKFDELLLSPGYEKLRGRLVRVFARRGCPIPEDLADETIARVLPKLTEVAATYEGDPVRYFYAVARNVYREYARRPQPLAFEHGADVAAEGTSDEREHLLRCLDRCLEGLAAADRELIQAYYVHEKSRMIDHRRRLAERLGIGANALRIRAFRIRQRLQRCVATCLEMRLSR